MESDLLVSKFKGPRTIALVKEQIKYASDGSLPHCARALKLGLEKSFKLKKKGKGVKLRCTYSSCTWYSNHPSYSTVGSAAIYCQMCLNNGWGSRYLRCAGCEYDRTAAYTSCQSCKKNFE